MAKKALILFSLFLAPIFVHANLFDSLKTVVGGHISDLQSRFKDEQLMDGTMIIQFILVWSIHLINIHSFNIHTFIH